MHNQELKYLRLFKEITKRINSSLNIGEVLRSITENIVKTLDVKGCAIFLLDKSRNKLLTSSSYGLSEAYVNKGPIDSEKSIVETLQGRWVLISDAHTNEKIQYQEEAKREGILSILSGPMSVKGKVIGVIRIYADNPLNLSDIENEFIIGLAEIGSIGIENARLYSHIKADHEKLINDVHQWFDYGATKAF
ncbi:MAG: GAF domain-containing protein [Desulfosarcinaceae bacterium]|nr:GAF domain-containing protein [Desulfosarcinaceae bacterium]